MTTRFPSPACPSCGGSRQPGRTTFAADLGSGVVVVRNVPAVVCSLCGEEWLDDATVQSLERITTEARTRKAQVEVVGF
jgi:YgiT-type zinc finger domain-containing protein